MGWHVIDIVTGLADGTPTASVDCFSFPNRKIISSLLFSQCQQGGIHELGLQTAAYGVGKRLVHTPLAALSHVHSVQRQTPLCL